MEDGQLLRIQKYIFYIQNNIIQNHFQVLKFLIQKETKKSKAKVLKENSL